MDNPTKEKSMIDREQLAEAARTNDARAEDTDVRTTLEAADVDTEAAFYVARQRAARVYAIFTGQLEAFRNGTPLDVKDEDVLNSLILASVDGIAIGALSKDLA